MPKPELMPPLTGRLRAPRDSPTPDASNHWLLLPVFLGVMALSVDMSYVYTQRRLVQNTADASAIAGYVTGANGKRWVVVALANSDNAPAARPAWDARCGCR